MVFKHKVGVISKFTKKVTVLVAAIAIVAQPMYGLITSQVAYAATSNVCSGGCDSAAFDTILAGSTAGDTLSLEGNITLSKMMTVDKSLTINGNGFNIIASFAFTGNDNNAAISLNGANGVVLNNVKVTNTGGTGLHGINAFKGSSTLNSVTISNFSKYGLQVNGSDVTVNNISTSANGWGGVGVDQNSTSNPAVLTVNGTSNHTDLGNAYAFGYTKHLFIDNTAKPVSIVDTGNQYNTANVGAARVYTLKPVLIAPPAAAAQTSQTVLQSDFANAYTTWTYHDDTAGPANAATPTPTETHKIAANPTPATGNHGAVRLNTAAGEKWNLASLQYSGTKLRDISALGFSAYTSNPGSAYINLDVDFNHPGTSGYQGRLGYTPNLTANTWGDSEAVASNSQWSISPNYNWPDGSTSETRSWNEIINAFPDATITAVDNQSFGSLYLRSDDASTTYFDNVYLATGTKNVKYNFELYVNEAPQLTVTSPAVNVTVSTVSNANQLKVQGSFTDDVKANYATLQLVKNGSSVAIGTLYGFGSVFNPAATYANADGSFTYNLSVPAVLADGEYSLFYTGTDFEGGITERMERKFIIDNTPPTIPEITAPTSNQEFPGTPSNIRAQWNASTDLGGLAKYQIEYVYTRNGTRVTDYRDVAASKLFRDQVLTGNTLSDFVIRVRAQDNSGNWSNWSTPVTYYYGVEAPVNNETENTNEINNNDTENQSTTDGASISQRGSTTLAALTGTTAITPAFQNFATVFNNDGTVSAVTAPTGETTDQDGQVLGAEDSLAKNAAQADTTSDDFKLLGFAWYWVIAALAALLAGWWLIAGYRRRKDEQA